LEARVGIEPTHKGFADLSLTTWVPRPSLLDDSNGSIAPRRPKSSNVRDPSRGARRRLNHRDAAEIKRKISALAPLWSRNKEIFWSGRRDLNPRLRPWQGRTLPLSYSRSETAFIIANVSNMRQTSTLQVASHESRVLSSQIPMRCAVQAVEVAASFAHRD
jgi:hypothetical protein